jgi:hypothetical protein
MDKCSCLVAPLCVTKFITIFTINLVTLSLLLKSDLDVKKTSGFLNSTTKSRIVSLCPLAQESQGKSFSQAL